MNFRTCRYFLTVCEMGTINAAARKLYISQQSLSEHMRKLEKELGVQLFHRDNPLSLTEAGVCFRSAAQDIFSALDRMNEQLAVIQGKTPETLAIGCVDYGTPDFLAPIVEIFLKRVPNVLLHTREILPREPIPCDITLLISARELGSPYKCEVLFFDRPVICVSDQLLTRLYGTQAEAHRERLRQGDIHALDGCPFIRHRNTPLEKISELAYEKNDYTPAYLPVAGSMQALTELCVDGQAAIVTFWGQTKNHTALPPAYPIANMPERIAASYICYRADVTLSNPARRFLEITRQYFKRNTSEYGPGPF